MKTQLHRINLISFFVAFGAVFAFLLYKALVLPITHDEVATTVFYSHFSNWEIMMYPDEWPNNHILNTLLAKGCIAVFGPEQWAVRLPNLLSFFVYAWGVYRIVGFILTTHSRFFVPFALLFVANPYMMDFFSLCRGYGMSIALSTLSASFLITGFKSLKDKHIWMSFFLALLASYANFTLLIFWAAVSLFAALYFIIRRKETKRPFWLPWALLILTGIGYLALIYVPIQKMQSTNQFIYWTSNGFITDTLDTLIRLSCQESGMLRPLILVAYAGLLLIVASWFYVLIRWKKTKFDLRIWREPIAVAPWLLLLTVLINITQNMVMGTPNLFGRTALFFYPMYMTALVSTYPIVHPLIKARWMRIAGVAGIVFLTTLHFVRASNTHLFREWFYDGYTFDVLAHIRKEHRSEPVSIETNWLFNPSFSFYRETGKLQDIQLGWYNKEIDTATTAEYYYVRIEDVPLLEHKFEIVRKWDDNILMRRKAE